MLANLFKASFAIVLWLLCTVANAAALSPALSSEWRAFYQLFDAQNAGPGFPAPPVTKELSAWRAYHDQVERLGLQMYAPILNRLSPVIRKRVVNEVPVLEVEPRHYQPSNKLVIYTHGGAYTLFSAESTAAIAALMAQATGLKVISIDYTTAPFADWRVITDQVTAVVKGLVAEGHSLKRMAIYGDSAGGGLAAGSVLKLRDQGLGMLAAVVLWSPWTDVTEAGDSNITLKSADVLIGATDLHASANAYAEPEDQHHPYVSPVYGDYSKGFPPTLIQAGSRECLLSDSIRLYGALDAAGRDVRLDLYDGLPHVFQVLLPESAESQRALRHSAEFIRQHLK